MHKLRNEINLINMPNFFVWLVIERYKSSLATDKTDGKKNKIMS